jgi:hypothetical protein
MTDHEDSEALEAEIQRLRAENDALAHQQDTAVLTRASVETHRWRWTGAIALLVIAALLTPPALVGFWGRRTIVDAQRYLDTVGPLASSPVIQDAVATEVSDQLLTAARSNLDGIIAQLNLPPAVLALRPAIAGAVDNFVETSVQKLIASDQFQALWIRVNQQVQQELVKALNGDTEGAVTIRDGTVYLDLSIVAQAVQQALVERGLTVLDRIQIPNTGHEIVLLSSSQLNTAQKLWTFTEPIAFWLLPITILLFLGAILLAPNRRRMLLVSGLVIVAGMALLAVALNIARSQYVDATSTATFSDALKIFFDTVVRYLWASLGALAVLGIVVAFFAWLGGPSAPAGSLRGLESRATTALGETAGRWEPMIAFGRLVARGRTALRVVILAAVIIGFIIHKQANWQNVMWCVGIVLVLWVIVDILAAAAGGRPAGSAVEAEVPAPVDA